MRRLVGKRAFSARRRRAKLARLFRRSRRRKKKRLLVRRCDLKEFENRKNSSIAILSRELRPAVLTVCKLKTERVGRRSGRMRNAKAKCRLIAYSV